jgi:hypothetical protein
VGDRWGWYGGGVNKAAPKLSTATATYRMQGQCDPSVTDDRSKMYVIRFLTLFFFFFLLLLFFLQQQQV